MNSLKREMILHIFKNFGVDIVGEKILQDLVISNGFKSGETITITDEEGPKEKAVWCSKLTVDSAVARVILSDVSGCGEFEFALVFRLNSLTAYGIRVTSDKSDEGIFSIQTQNGDWTEASTQVQANFLAGLEQIFGMMFSWEIDTDSDLFECFVNFLTSGDN